MNAQKKENFNQKEVLVVQVEIKNALIVENLDTSPTTALIRRTKIKEVEVVSEEADRIETEVIEIIIETNLEAEVDRKSVGPIKKSRHGVLLKMRTYRNNKINGIITK